MKKQPFISLLPFANFIRVLSQGLVDSKQSPLKTTPIDELGVAGSHIQTQHQQHQPTARAIKARAKVAAVSTSGNPSRPWLSNRVSGRDVPQTPSNLG